ncbi:RNA-directed DNA polymerase [Erythrobacter neustonensis]|uniref:RNA-directed DNA polymerase n=1 Tax=Erythrobacter neustonensis TaxID=1112 RepID=UPI000B08F0A5|nr:RNA-directed DNA polymerase [Erythrobacter neustonensis]
MDATEFRRIESAIELAVTRILEKGADDLFRPPVFSYPIETQVLRAHPDDFRRAVKAETIKFLKRADLEQERIGPTRKTLVAKDENTFRQVAWLDPFDAVKYLSLAVLAFEKIEALRPARERKIIHSHRRSDSPDQLFDEDFGYDSFRAESSRLSKEKIGHWKVITDISNFFDRIGNHTLENHLLDCGLERKYCKLICEILFFWAGDRRSFGIPVGSDASRILSEAVLIDVDRKLIEEGVTFIRYVDDYRIFAETKEKALKCVERLTALLADEGLSLNSRKTDIVQIVDADEAASMANRFDSGEHQKLDLEEQIEVRKRIRISGTTSISKFYRRPGQEFLKKLQLLDKAEILALIASCEDYQFEDNLKTAVKFFVHVDQDTKILKTCIERRITSIIYIADALIKEKENLPEGLSSELCELIFNGFDWLSGPYPLLVPILRLSSQSTFADSRYVDDIVAHHSQLDSLIFFREAISIGYPCLDRSRIRALAIDVSNNVPDFVRRSIYFAVASHSGLSPDEKRPLLKTMKQHSPDWFIERIDAIIGV